MADHHDRPPHELIPIDLVPPERDWRDPSIDFQARRGTWS